MTRIDTLIVQSNIERSHQFSTSVAEYIENCDIKILTYCFKALPVWLDMIKNTGLIVQNLEDFLIIILATPQ